jgi:hypothetical protein
MLIGQKQNNEVQLNFRKGILEKWRVYKIKNPFHKK